MAAEEKQRDQKISNKEEILSMWPQAAAELRVFQNALAVKSGLTASQLGMALQLANAEFTRLLRGYTPATSPQPITIGRTDCPLVVLRSHPNFPNALAPELEGVWTDTNPAWPQETVKLILKQLDPPCHTDWKDFDNNRIEKSNNLEAFVVYVKPGPGPRPQPSI